LPATMSNVAYNSAPRISNLEIRKQ